MLQTPTGNLSTPAKVQQPLYPQRHDPGIPVAPPSSVRPEVFFFLGVAQALAPYVLWPLGIGLARIPLALSYRPVLLWLIAFVCFCIGSRLARRKRIQQRPISLAPAKPRIYFWSGACVVLIGIQLVWAISVYGTLPLLSYVKDDGKVNVNTANELQQSSSFGQFGVLTVTVLITTGVLLTLILVGLQDRKKYRIPSVCLFIVLSIANLANGKRQGVFISVVYLATGLTIAYGGSFRALGAAVPILKNKATAIAFIFLMGWLGVAFMGYMARARTQQQAERSGSEEIVAYLDYPLLNMESQCDQAKGLGPYQFQLLYPFRNMVPSKWLEYVESDFLEPPSRVERSSPSSMLEYIQWGWGPVGLAAYALFLGFFSTWLFRRSRQNLAALLTYPLVAYALLTVHSYNHFLNLTFIPIPCIALCVYAKSLPQKYSFKEQRKQLLRMASYTAGIRTAGLAAPK